MKKRSQTTNQQTFNLSKSLHQTTKKKYSEKEMLTKSKSNKQKAEKISKNEKTNKKEDKTIDDYVMINGDIYKANTNTERMDVHCFVNRFKRETIHEKNFKNREKMDYNKDYRMISEEKKVEVEPQNSIEIEQIIKNLPIEQKMCLMRQLEKELGNNPELISEEKEIEIEKEIETEDSSIEKYNILNIKLNTLEEQLENKKEKQINKINQIFYNGELTASERKNKILYIHQKQSKKLKIINCTRNLFYTLLYHKSEPDFFNHANLDEAMKELDSFSDGDHNVKSERSFQGQIKKEDPVEENSIQSESEFDNKVGLANQLNIKTEDHIDTSDKKSFDGDSLLLSPEEKSERENENERFECQEENLTKKFKIPLLLTKEKMEELEWEKKAKSLQKMKVEIDRKIAFQSSEIEIEELPMHFTTLGDINMFIMGLYEYVMKTDLDRVVEHLNFPYGKPICDKLFLLQQNGEIDDTEYYPVLNESQLNDYIVEVALKQRRFTEEEKIHNKAVFDCFNTHLNAYRPYYDLEGDVYPWSVSEKGITFYEINEENIEEVFEKTKIKVLEYCSLFCGIQPLGIEGNEGYEILKEKNDDQAKKESKQSLVEEFGKWSIKLTDYDAMVRLLISEEIISSEMAVFAKEFSEF